jgi:hypothetical protein
MQTFDTIDAALGDRDFQNLLGAQTTTAVFVVRGDARGDLSHLVAAMKIKPGAVVVFVGNQAADYFGVVKSNQWFKEKGYSNNQLSALDHEWGDNKRAPTYRGDKDPTSLGTAVAGFDMGDRAVVIKNAGSGQGGYAAVEGFFTKMRAGAPASVVRKLCRVTDSTKVLIEEIASTKKPNLVAEALQGGPVARGEFDDRLAAYGLDRLRVSNIVVLWGRASEHPALGGAHYDVNHSNYAWCQLVCGLLADGSRGKQILLAGDVVAAKLEKFRNITPTTRCDVAAWNRQVTFIGKFWDANAGAGLAALSRRQQLRFFAALAARQGGHGTVLHVGMRSGGLDFLGLAGLKVLYIHPKGSVDARMEPVVQTFKKLQDKHGATPNIQRVDVERNPKRWKEYSPEGQIAAFPDPERKPPRLTRGATATPDTENKGFLEKDLNELVGTILFELK